MNPSSPSIRRRLLVALLSTILVVWGVVVLLVYHAAQHEVEEVFDADLARNARTLQTLLLHEVLEDREIAARLGEVMDEIGGEELDRYPVLAGILREMHDEENRERLELIRRAEHAGTEYESGLLVVARYADGDVMLRDADAPQLPLTDPGLTDVDLNGNRWRIYRLTDADTGLTLQVGERYAFREELVRYITRNSLVPMLVAVPVLALLAWFVVGHALAPLRRVTAGVSQRDPDTLDPLDERNAPQEIGSLVAALNRLFARVSSTLERERHFTADAAHELRTPLAAIKTHLQVALGAGSGGGGRASIERALQGVDRATHTVEQLLLLARVDAERPGESVAAPVDLRELVIEAVTSLSQSAVDQQIDIGIDAPRPVSTHGDRAALQVMLRNLIDNSIRYTPAGGRVTVAAGLDAGIAWLSVSDDGPGIPADDLPRVFDRFYRGYGQQPAPASGSGLGLSIVRRIAHLHHARIVLGSGLDGKGLGVTVRFESAA